MGVGGCEGIALSVVVATGTFIWLDKRERRGKASTRLRAAWWGLVAGVPAALVLTLVARLVLGNTAPFVAIFWIACVLAVLLPVIAAQRSLSGQSNREVAASAGMRGIEAS